jgi:flavin reductase (DIM6/NTAB) family NADH-FMN oxidoreductase RutF/rubredoxin
MISIQSLFKISYGLYIVSSGDKTRGNGFIANTVFQVTAEPPNFAVCCNKNNLTAEFIKKSGAYAFSVLAQTASPEIFGKFGYKSGKDLDKMAGTTVKYESTGVPIVLDECIAYFECKLIQIHDAGTHLIFIGELLNSQIIDDTGEPLTYSYYRYVKKGIVPKNAPTYIDKTRIEAELTAVNTKKYRCSVCGYIYDESAEPLKFKDLPDNWTCPVCGSEKSEFEEIQ